jgi:hypothetical protein
MLLDGIDARVGHELQHIYDYSACQTSQMYVVPIACMPRG